MLWCFARVFIRAPAGRQRFNVLAALNAITHELVMVTNDTYINASTVCELLHQLAAGSASDVDIDLIKYFMINKLLISISTSRTLPSPRCTWGCPLP